MHICEQFNKFQHVKRFFLKKVVVRKLSLRTIKYYNIKNKKNEINCVFGVNSSVVLEVCMTQYYSLLDRVC